MPGSTAFQGDRPHEADPEARHIVQIPEKVQTVGRDAEHEVRMLLADETQGLEGFLRVREGVLPDRRIPRR